MRIAVFYHLPFGGAKRVVREHVKGLSSLGHIVDVYSVNQQKDMFDPAEVSKDSFNYIHTTTASSIPFISRIVKDIQIFVLLKRLHKKIAIDIDRKNYDIVLVHTDTYTQAPYILRFLKTENVYYCLEPLRIVHEYSLRAPDILKGLHKIYELFTRSIRRNIDTTNARAARHTLTLSLFGREYMILAFNLYPEVAYLGVDERLFSPQKLKRKRQVLFVAEQEYIYGYDLAEKAMELIPEEKRPKMVLVFGTKKSQRITDQELVKLYSESMVTLSLSRYDTFGLVPLESMACRTPVIALNVAGYRETILNCKTGYLVDFEPQEIAARILEFLENPSKVEQMGKTGRNWIESKWTWERQVKELEEYLITFLNNS